MQYYILADELTVLGFSMAGVKGVAIENSEEAENGFNKAIEDKNIGIILITERIAELIRPLVDHYLFTADFPLVVEIPDRFGLIEGRKNIREMVNQAIGIKL